MQKKRDEIVNLLMWEICKTLPDGMKSDHDEKGWILIFYIFFIAQKEVDRTIKYIADTIKEVKSLENKESTFVSDTGVFAQVHSHIILNYTFYL